MQKQISVFYPINFFFLPNCCSLILISLNEQEEFYKKEKKILSPHHKSPTLPKKTENHGIRFCYYSKSYFP